MSGNIGMSELRNPKPTIRPLAMTCARMDSCLGEPSTELALALKENDLRLFCDVLSSDELEVNKELEDADFSTILYVAAAAGKTNFVKEILRHKESNPNQPHRISKKFPIHVAAEEGFVEILQLLVQSGADVNAKMENGSTALHLLAVRSAGRWAPDGSRDLVRRRIVQAMEFMLRQPGINVDLANSIGVTPIYFAVEKGTEEVVKLLLNARACITAEVDGQTAEDLLEEKMPALYESLDLSQNKVNREGIENELFQILYSEAHESMGGKFIKTWDEAEKNNNKVKVNADNGTYTFLQYACDQGLDQIVDFLLSKGANPNLYCNNYKMPPVVIAGHHGYFQILRIFKEYMLKQGLRVNFSAIDGIKRENVLHKVLKAESKAYVNFDKRNYDRCLNLLLDNNLTIQKLMQPAIDAPDQLGNTPLHDAAHIGNEDAIRKLLRCGANIGLKNRHDQTPIDKIPPHIMEEFLDDCLQGDGLPVDEEFKLTFKYNFLGPPLRRKWKEDQLLKELEENDDEDDDEDNVALPEAEPLWYLSQSPAHRGLLTHPVISSFLCLKWRRIRPYFYTNLIFYLIFVALLTTYLLILTKSLKIVPPENGAEENGTAQETPPPPGLPPGLKEVTAVFLVILAAREIFQAMVSFRRYIFSFENLLEITMIVVLIPLFFCNIEDETTIRSLSGVGLLLSWTEMVLLFGRHPKLSTYITMFHTVSVNFLKFLTWYLSFILAFGLTFFIVLPTENDYFLTVDKSLLKTVIMSLTGEIEFEDIQFGGLLPVFLFLLYVFFIMLVLVNLLNGLAVSDIAEIQKHAEVVSHVSRVELVSYMESMLLGDPFQFLSNWPPGKWLRKLPACSCLGTLYALRPVRKIFNTVIGNTSLFQSRLTEKRALFHPNQSRFERSLPGPEKDNLIMDDTILKSATELIIRKQNEDSSNQRLAQIETGLKLLSSQQNHIIEMLNSMKSNRR